MKVTDSVESGSSAPGSGAPPAEPARSGRAPRRHRPAATTGGRTDGEGTSSGLPGDRQWFVLMTKSRQEKALARALDAMCIDCYLPLVREERQEGRKRSVNQVPLFSGYVFLNGTIDEVYEADRTRRVARTLAVPDQERMEGELRSIRHALREGARFDPYPFLSEGSRVEVKSGPFQGVRGVVEHRRGVSRLVLQVEAIGRAVSLEIDAANLRSIE